MSDSDIIFLSIVAAIAPTLVYIGIIYWIDRYEKEPWWLLAATFFWGAVPSILIAYVFNSYLSIPVYLIAGESTGDTLTASFIAPPVEETIKGLALLLIFFFWRHEIDSPLDGIIYGAMVGMGFAMVENVYYFLNVYSEGGLEAWGINIFVRSILFGLNHALFSSMAGLGIAVARMSRHQLTRVLALLTGWFTAVFLHFLHNLTVSSGNLLCLLAFVFDWGGLVLTLIIVVWALLQERRWLRQYLREEVALGTLTTSQYHTACSGRRRTGHRLQVLRSRGFRAYRRASRFYFRCSELAYKKHHFALFEDKPTASMISNIREELAGLSRAMI